MLLDMENLLLTNASLDTLDDGSVPISNIVTGNENLDVDFLEDLDSYWDDINDRLTISRMVSDSVIRGMVSAVEKEASEKIAQKDLEVCRLRETLHLYHVGADENEMSESHLMHNEVYSSFKDSFIEHEKIKGSLVNLKTIAKSQLKMLVEEINKIRGLNPMKGTNLGSEILGLGGVLQENVSEKWTGVDKMLDSLKNTLDTAFKGMDNMVYLSKESLSLWKKEHDFQEDTERAVIKNFVRCLKEEFEEKLWEQNAHSCGNENLDLLEKISEISSLRQELDSISKSISVLDGQPHGFLEADEEGNQKRTDHLQHKVSGSHISSSTLWEANGKHEEESVTSTSENLDALRNMSHDQLISHFKNVIYNMKRDHDYKMQEMTEDYFKLKREILNLKERGSFSPVKRDKEFDTLRKKIPDVILKLDKILLENEKLATSGNNDASLGTLRSSLDSLLLENHQLKDSLTDKKKEVNLLYSQVSDAAEKISQLSQIDENLLKVVRKLESAVGDSHIEAFISQNVYACFLRESIDQIRCINEELYLEHNLFQEVYEFIFRGIASERTPETKDCFEGLFIDSISQDLCMVVFKEALKEAEDKLSDLNMKYSNEIKVRVSLEMNVSERDNALRLEVQEKERLKQEILSLKGLVEDKEKLVQRAEDALAKETERHGLASQELSNLRYLISQQERTILKISEEPRVMKGKLAEALEKSKAYEVEKHELWQKLELAKEELKKTNDEKMMVIANSLEKQQKLSTVEAKAKEHMKQLRSLLFDGLGKEFAKLEHRVAENIQKSNSRLKNLHGQLNSLEEQANELKATRLMYKQRLERKCSDLQKAETEVDILGDEVDVLLDLLEKTYVALDHYSPVLKHYPGIIEILKLVGKELIRESRRLI